MNDLPDGGWYLAVSTDIDRDGFYVMAWDDGGLCGATPASAMEGADEGRVYLMWHIDNGSTLPTRTLPTRTVPEEHLPLVGQGDARMVVKVSPPDRVLMIDNCHMDTVRFKKQTRMSRSRAARRSAPEEARKG